VVVPPKSLFRALPARALARLAVVLCVLLAAAPASARFQTGGFNLDELVAAGGAGPDPGTAVLQARLKWAVETAIPTEWRESVSVVWTVGEVSRGHLALSYLDGRTILSPRLMSRSSEEVLATVAHEMGHQIAFALVSPVVGMPPDAFIDIAPPYTDVREGWADCVARVWTGSTLRTLSEAGPCNSEMAAFVSGLLADPATLGATARITPPPIRVPAAPPAPAVTAPLPEPIAAPAPAAVVLAQEAPRPRSAAAPQRREPAGSSSSGLLAFALIPIPLVLCGVGYWLVRKRSEGLLAWATGTARVKQPG
jgi:hypothetical protein